MIDRIVIDRLEAMPIEGVAERLGLSVSRHKSLCPFHDDSRPSLTFNTYRNRFRCFVCDAHGGPIDLVMKAKGLNFREACSWLDSSLVDVPLAERQRQPQRQERPLDLEWLSKLIEVKAFVSEAQQFLFEERHIDPRVAEWCGLTSIAQPMPCWRYGKPFFDAPSLLIPYYDIDGRLMSVQSRYLGTTTKTTTTTTTAEQSEHAQWAIVRAAGEQRTTTRTERNHESSQIDTNVAERQEPNWDKPRFKFPRGSNCHIYNLPILRMLKPGEPLWIAEGASDCWALLSSGRKAIAIPSATLLKDKDIEPLRGLNLHMYPDQDRPGEKLFLDLRERLPQIERHQLPTNCKDFSDYWKNTFLNL